MSRIHSKNTAPELAVRKWLHNYGIRYRLHVKNLPGKPDLSNKKKKFAIFVNGCFWHQHVGCKRATMPKSNIKYWKNKLETNVKRLNENQKELEESGYSVFVIWECEAKNQQTINNLTTNITRL
jgi:DNA mismatch endonuclease (patch repair protein)